jgi:hypothetical protein
VLDYRYIRVADAWRGLDIRLGSDVPYYPYSDTMLENPGGGDHVTRSAFDPL